VTAPVAPAGPVARGVARSTVAQLGAKGLHLVLNLVSTLAIIRYLEPGAYGMYVLALSTTMLVGLFADFGLAKLAVREIALDADGEEEILGTVVGARLLLGVIAIGITQLLLVLLGAPAEVHAAAFVASLIFFGDAILAVVVVFHVRIRQEYEALIRVGAEVVETTIVLVLIARGASLMVLFAAPVLATTVGSLVAVWLARRRYGIHLRFARHRVGHLLREALPIGPALLIGVIYLKLDGLLLARFRSPEEVGLYGSAYQPIEYLFLATAVVINVMFPLLAHAHASADPARFEQLYRRCTETLVAAMLAIPAILLFTAEPMLDLAFGPSYAAAADPLRILALALVLMTVNGWQSFVLLAGGRQGVTLRYNAVALAIAAIAGVALIPGLGMVGAACAAMVTAVFVLVASTRAVSAHLDTRLDAGPLVRIIGAAAGLCGALAVADVAGAPWPTLFVVALVVYPALLVGLGVVRAARLRELWNARNDGHDDDPGTTVDIDRPAPIDLRPSDEGDVDGLDPARAPAPAGASRPVVAGAAPGGRS
jgi:O-antigen/teichoic acid export membrane protein